MSEYEEDIEDRDEDEYSLDPRVVEAILDAVVLAEALQNHESDIEAALRIYERTRLGPTSDVVYSNRQYGPEAILQIVEDRMTSPDDRVEDVITRAEINEITMSYRKIAGFDVEDLNRS